VLYLTVGLPGAGKTTLARRIADTEGILRLTPDEWMAPLFNDSDGDGRRDILEGRMIWVAHEVLRSKAAVVLDFGCWSPDERYAIRVIAESVGARFDLRHVSLEEAERRARARSRWESAPGTTFPMSDADHDRFLALCQPRRRRNCHTLPCRTRRPASIIGSTGQVIAGPPCRASTRSRIVRMPWTGNSLKCR
jgi:predicted kinase